MEKALFSQYEKYKEQSLKNRFFKHKDVLALINNYQNIFAIDELGRSTQGRAINLISIGNGKTKVLLWSQMHGDEPTATMALFDILNFFRVEDDFSELKRELLSRLTLYLIPMLNPDGAEAYSRRNASGIDLNRDAIRLSSPEARIFKAAFDKIRPHFAFNLHDQDPRYTVGDSYNRAAISFLAPASDYGRSENETRIKAMKLIGEVNSKLQDFIPGLVGKFSDEYSPRAFGDNAQKWGTSTILVESGGFAGDPEKQFLRKLNFVLLLSAINSIATEGFNRITLDAYYDIPENSRNYYDFIIRDASVEIKGNFYTLDIGINRYELPLEGGVYVKSKIEEVGDLNFAKGGEEFHAKGMIIRNGQTSSNPIIMIEITANSAYQYLKEGITYLRVVEEIMEERPAYLPINVINRKISAKAITVDSLANLVLTGKDGKVKFVVINGKLIDLTKTLEGDCKSGLFLV